MIKKFQYKNKIMKYFFNKRTLPVVNTNNVHSRNTEFINITLNIKKTWIGTLRLYKYDGFSCGISRMCEFQSFYECLYGYFLCKKYPFKLKNKNIPKKMKSIITKDFIKGIIIDAIDDTGYSPAFIEMSVIKSHPVCEILHDISDVQTYARNGNSGNEIGVFLIKWGD